MTGDPITDTRKEELNVVPINTIRSVSYESQPWQRKKSSEVRMRKCPTIKIECEGVVTEALVDTGCTTTVVSEEFYNELIAKGKQVMCLPMNRAFVIGATQKKSSPITKQIMFKAEIGDQAYEIVALVVKNLLYPTIIGTDFLSEQRAIIDLDRKVIELGYQRIEMDMGKEEEFEACTGVLSEEGIEEKLRQQVNQAEALEDQQRSRLLEILIENKKVFQKNREPIKGFEFRIQLTDYTPFKQRNYPIPVALRQQVAELLASMVNDGIIKKEKHRTRILW